MHPDLNLVIKLQGLDHRISKLENEVAALPKHIAVIEKALDSHNRRLEADRAALIANQRDRKNLDNENQALQQKIGKLREQTLQSKTNEQYKAFQSEIAHFEGEVRKSEDRILDLMGESEPLEANVKKAEVALKAEKAQVDGEKAHAIGQTAADKKALSEIQSERSRIASQVTPELLRMYERARKKWKNGTGIAEVQDGRCTACNMGLRPQHFQNLRAGTQTLTCETCGRILFYNPPVSLETEMADRQVK